MLGHDAGAAGAYRLLGRGKHAGHDGHGAAVTASLQNAFTVGPVNGGRNTNPLWKSQVSDDNFQAALSQSLSAQSMLASGAPRYTLNVQLVSLRQPFMSLNTTVTADVHYTVVSAANNKVAFDTEITTPYTAPYLQQPIDIIRLKDANEGAMAANIQALLGQLNAAGQPGQPLGQ